MGNRINNSKSISILEADRFKVLQFCEQDNDLFHTDELLFVNKHTNRVNEIDCIRAIQLLRKEGYDVGSAQIRILIEDDIVEDPAGEITFCCR